MDRSDVVELHYITKISNLPSILSNGILSHRLASQVNHISVAMTEIQDKRSRITIPGGCPLHDYANLYFHARNAMLYKRRSLHEELCVLRINPNTLDQEGVIIADGNASSEYTRFYKSPDGLQYLDRRRVFAEYWTDSDPIIGWEKKRVRCAEVLVPDRVNPKLIMGVYVSCDDAVHTIDTMGLKISYQKDKHMFFLDN